MPDNKAQHALPVMAYDGHLDICGQAIIQVFRDLDVLNNSSSFSIEEIFFVSDNGPHIQYLNDVVALRLY